MSSFPKHEATAPRKGTKKQPRPAVQPVAPAITVEVDMTGVEYELANLALSVRSYGVNATNGDNSLALYTDPSENAYPMRLQLEGEAVDRIAGALERIATVLEAKAL